MSNCSDCKNNGTQICSVCCSYQGYPDRWEAKPKTNADRFFRNATNEQLAQYMDKIASCEFCPARRERCGYGHGCIDAWLEWLKQEAEI